MTELEPMVPDVSENDVRLPDEVTISVERMIRFCHLADMTHDYSSPGPQPEEPPLHITRFGTLLTLTVSFMFSLFEDRQDSVNLRRIWTGFPHPFCEDLEAFERDLEPFKDSLRSVRNRYDFHGSLSRRKEAAGFNVYDLGRAAELFRLVRRCRELCGTMIKWFTDLPKERHESET